MTTQVSAKCKHNDLPRYCEKCKAESGEAGSPLPVPTPVATAPTLTTSDSAAAQINVDDAAYVKRIVDRFKRYKNPGRDAEQYVMEIIRKWGFGAGNDPLNSDIHHLGMTVGESTTRHLCDIIGWVFEIDAYNSRDFQWASVTHTMKNFRDHLLKEKSSLEDQYMNFCCDWNGYKHGKRGSVTYAMSTVQDPEFLVYQEEFRKKMAARRARPYEDSDDQGL